MSVTCPKCNHSFVPPTKVNPPKDGTLCGQVWDLCNTLKGDLGRYPTRTEVLTEGMKVGLNPSTTLTQMGKWMKTQKDLNG